MKPSPMTRIEQMNNQIDMLNSEDGLKKLRGFQNMRMLPQVYRQEGGMTDVPMTQEQPPMAEEDVSRLQQAAKQLASLGRGGDTELVHMTPDELQGLMSLGELTYNPITGLPEAFKIGRIFKSITKPIKNIVKSDAFKVLAPIVLGVAAPYALGAGGLFGSAGLLGLPAAGSMTALQFGATTALGTGLGSLLAGQKPKDALKSALVSGALAGGGRALGNYLSKAPTDTVGKVGGNLGTESQVIKNTPTNIGTGNVSATPDKFRIAGGAPLSESERLLSAGVTPSGSGNLLLDEAVKTSGVTFPTPQQDIARITGEGAVKPIQKEAITKSFTERLKDVGKGIADDMIVRKPEGGLNLLKTASNVGKAIGPITAGETVADMSAMQDRMLTEEEYLADPEFQERFPNYQAYVTSYMSRRRAPQIATEQEAIQRFVASKEGGLINLAEGGEFSGMVPGQGGGMDDNVFMPIKEGKKRVGTLAVSPTEYVVDSYTMAALGDGNPDEGAKVMDKTIKQIRKKAYGTTEQPNEIDGLRTLVPLVRSVG
jgi:hypothetical protein|tara:strand:+ start:912 stop:2534 length:1623 start_codon:yes stop_codon:yes gene_type:complete